MSHPFLVRGLHFWGKKYVFRTFAISLERIIIPAAMRHGGQCLWDKNKLRTLLLLIITWKITGNCSTTFDSACMSDCILISQWICLSSVCQYDQKGIFEAKIYIRNACSFGRQEIPPKPANFRFRQLLSNSKIGRVTE